MSQSFAAETVEVRVSPVTVINKFRTTVALGEDGRAEVRLSNGALIGKFRTHHDIRMVQVWAVRLTGYDDDTGAGPAEATDEFISQRLESQMAGPGRSCTVKELEQFAVDAIERHYRKYALPAYERNA